MERMDLISKFHQDLMNFAGHLQNQGILDISCINQIEELYELAKIKKLDHKKIGNYTANIAQLLSGGLPQISSQCRDYWNAWREVFEKISPLPVDMRQKVDAYIADMEEIDTMYKAVINANPNSNDVALYGVFYMHILKRERIEYAMMSDLDTFKEHISEFDLVNMFSTGEKVKKGSKFVTHGNAIRDSLAHKKFKIFVNNGIRYIHFGNNEHGYDFLEEWKIDDFLHYIQSTDFLYRTMFTLQKLIMFMTLLHEAADRQKKPTSVVER